MFSNLKQRIIMPVILVLAGLMIITILLVSDSTDNLIATLSDQRITGLQQAVHAHLEGLRTYSHLVAYSIATDESFISIFEESDRQKLLQYLTIRKQIFETSGLVLTDNYGYVILRTREPDSYGDYIGNCPCISSALHGERKTTHTTTYTSLMAMASAAPVLNENGEQLGVVAAYFDMADHDFVDGIAAIFNAEVTVFHGDTSVAGTIRMTDGERTTGTPARADIVQTVLIEGEHKLLTLDILGRYPHTAYYFPLFSNPNEAPVGMFFIGFSNEHTNTATEIMQNSLFVIGILGGIISAVILYFVLSKATQRAATLLNVSEESLRQREMLLSTVNQTAKILLTADENNALKAIMEGMEIVGHCVDVDRVQIWRNEVIDGELSFVMRYEWLSDIGKEKVEVPLGLHSPYSKHTRWYDMFLRRESINAPISTLPPEEAAFLGEYEMVSIVIIPMFIDKEMIGFFSVDDCRCERVFSEDEMDMLSSTGLMLASIFDKQAQARLRRDSETIEKTNLILESAPMAITLFDKKLQPIDCNKATINLFGLTSKEEYIETYFSSMTPTQPDNMEKSSQKCIMTHLEKALADGYSYLPEFVSSRADGTLFITENTYIRRKYKDGFAVIEYTRDITAKKEAESREREMEKRLHESQMIERQKSERQAMELTRKLVNNAPVLIELWEEDGSRIIGCNDYLLETLGITDENEYADNWDKYNAPLQADGTPAAEYSKKYIQFAAKHGEAKCEWRFLLPNGEELPVECTCIKIEHDNKSMIIAYSIDLRPLKNAVAAEESNKAKTRFLARMSHEIRTPISAVLGISEIQLRKQELPPQIEEAFFKIYDSSKTLLKIVNDILDFSKIESGKMPILNKEYEIARLISDMSHLHLVYADNKDVQFMLNVDENLPEMLFGDALRIRQIVTNLLTNAFKYTERGFVTMSIGHENKSETSLMLVISIQDSGIGMTDSQIAELKGEYIRFHENEKPFVGGTGLGIPIVYSLVEMMGAEFDLTSNAGKGTHAVIRIPQQISSTEILGKDLAASLQNFESKTWSVAKDLAFVPTQLPHGKVLVVDDVDTNLYVAEAMLESFGLTVELCESAAEALEKIEQGNAYDIIFMDHMMPVMDGIEATKILRGMDYTKPIVALTANAVKGQAEMFTENGFDSFIAKPIDIQLLNSTLLRFIEEK
ncbi:MAG: response regulator [Defluviitaleaceae bacterium]|nr:response regulator [Defluviitaleaceae bacterium]MCL2262083.1 response regulator [Defluviitaleaceae bacterium]